MPRFINIDYVEKVSQEDLDAIFMRLQLPGLLLTGKKVRRSKQAVQDAFSVLNANMATIDQNMRDLLFLVQDLARVIYLCMESRVAHVHFNVNRTNERIKKMGANFPKVETKLMHSMNDSILQSEKRLDLKMREDALVGHFMQKMEAWVVQLARGEADKSVVQMKRDAIQDAVAAANESTEERLELFERSIHELEQAQNSRTSAERIQRSMTTVAPVKDALYAPEEVKDRDDDERRGSRGAESTSTLKTGAKGASGATPGRQPSTNR